MAKTEIGTREARSQFADLIGRAHFAGERIALLKHGKPFAGLVSAEDLERLEALQGEPVAPAGPGVPPSPRTRLLGRIEWLAAELAALAEVKAAAGVRAAALKAVAALAAARRAAEALPEDWAPKSRRK